MSPGFLDPSPFVLGDRASPLCRMDNIQLGNFSLPFADEVELRDAVCQNFAHSTPLIDFADSTQKPLPVKSPGRTLLIALHPSVRSFPYGRLCQ